MFYVYILYAPTTKKTYTGYTSDLERRLLEHNVVATTGYTIRYRPWVLLHTENFERKTDAMKRERYFKTGVGREFIKKLIIQKFAADSGKD